MRPRQASMLRVLFLWEQVRDLRIQEFLRELVVGVAAPSDHVGSILVEIPHSVEGGDVEKCARPLKQFSRVCDSSLFHSLVFISCMLLLFTSLYT